MDSAFKSAQHSAGPGPVHRLYQVKGRRNIRATERDLSWASFNTGDCFILDLGETIFTWCGAQCNVLERSRAQELAAAIRDGQRGSKVRLEMVMDGEEPPEMLQVLGPKPTLTEGSPEEDAAADRDAGTAVLYKVSDATGHMDLSEVARSCPFNQSLLCPDDCFVLDTGAGGKVYVWKGRKANEQERQAALSGRADHHPHGLLAPHTGGNPASGPRDAPLQAVLQRLEVRGHRGDRAAQGQAVTPIPTATVFPTAPPSLCQLRAQPSAVPSHHPYHIQGRAIPMPAPSPHHPTANAISSPVSVASHPSANPVPIPCCP